MIIVHCDEKFLLENELAIKKLLEDCIDSSFELDNEDEKRKLINDKFNNMCKYVHVNATILCAVENGNTVGFLWAYPIDEMINPSMHIAYIAVDRKFREIGIGRALVESIGEYAMEKNIKFISLNVSPINKKGLEFYRALEFNEKSILLEKQIL